MRFLERRIETFVGRPQSLGGFDLARLERHQSTGVEEREDLFAGGIRVQILECVRHILPMLRRWQGSISFQQISPSTNSSEVWMTLTRTPICGFISFTISKPISSTRQAGFRPKYTGRMAEDARPALSTRLKKASRGPRPGPAEWCPTTNWQSWCY